MSLWLRNFQLHHPWLWLLGSVCGFVLLLGLLCLPVWGWIELRFSPVQRHYLPVYLESSVGVVAGSGPDYVEWIRKKGPGRDWEIAGPEDLVPAKQDDPPFHLSPAALARGWTDLGYNTDGIFEQRDVRDTLQASIFDGHSLLYFVLQPFELFLVGYLCWKVFDRWREQQARKRGAKWGVDYRAAPWDEDLALLLKQLAQGTGKAAVQTGRWMAARRQSMRQPATVTVVGATVPLTGPPSIMRPTSRPENIAPANLRVTEAAPVPSPSPTVFMTKPSQAATPKAQPVKPQSVPPVVTKSVPSSPFGKAIVEGEPGRKWDMSQWID